MVLNGVAGGLKDIDHDHLVGATTTAYRLGARLYADNRIAIPYKLRAYAIGSEALLFAIVSVPLIGNWLAYTKIQVLMTIGVLVVLATIAFVQLAQALRERDFQKLPARLFGHSIPTFCAVPSLLFFHVGGWRTVVFLLFLFGWAGFWRVANPKLRSLQ